jgi:phage baseplate assembly protein V
VNVITRLMRSLRMLVTHGEVSLSDDSLHPPRLQIQGVAGEVLDRVPMLTPFGVATRPPIGSRALLLALGGDRAQLVVVSAGHKDYRGPSLAEGELALHSVGGTVLHVKNDGSVHVTGDVTASGDVSDSVGTLAALRTAFNVHTHPVTGSTTGPPVTQV